MDNPVQIFLHHVAQYVGDQWAAVLLAVLWLPWLLRKLGFFEHVSWLRATSAKAKLDERQLLSEDQARLIKDLREELTNLRRWWREDVSVVNAQIALLREEFEQEQAQCKEQISSLIKDAARWRHLVGNLAQHIGALRYKLQAAGIEVARFEGWAQFIADGGDPGLQINDF